MILRDFCLPRSPPCCLPLCSPRCACLRCLVPCMLGLSVALPLLGLARSWHVFQSFGSVLVLLTMIGQALSQCSFLDISCCNEMHGCWHGAAMMASAAALLYLSSKFVMQAAAAVHVALLHTAVCRLRKPGLPCREKGENRLCEGGGKEDQGATCGGFYAFLGTLG